MGLKQWGPLGKASTGKRILGQCFGYEISYGALRAWGRAQPGGYMISEDSGWNDITWPESIDSKEKRAEGEALNVPTLRGKEPEKRL